MLVKLGRPFEPGDTLYINEAGAKHLNTELVNRAALFSAGEGLVVSSAHMPQRRLGRDVLLVRQSTRTTVAIRRNVNYFERFSPKG